MAAPVDNALADINQSFKEKAAQKRANELGMEYIDVAQQPINPDLFTIIDLKTADRLKLTPFQQIGNTVKVAISDPTNPEIIQLLSTITEQKHLQINQYLATPESVTKALSPFVVREKARAAEIESTKVVDPKSSEAPQDLDRKEQIARLSKLGAELHDLGESTNSLAKLELGACDLNASDIHFQPEADSVQVRFRIDGVLQSVTTLELDIYQFFATQIKHKAGMKINVTSIPQDGRYSFQYQQTKVDVRASSIPTTFGESLVLRFLHSDNKIKSFAELGYTEPTLSIIQAAGKLTQGMVVVTGPTGSGKSTTLYTLLNELNTADRKIITLEDPVEYKIPGIVQSPINKAAGYTFAKGLESILRQDPDVIMVGEIRDQATAETAAQAALTGHIVLCTLHTNNAIQSLPRLINMGVKPFIAAPALRTIVAQRLVRKLCECKEAYQPTSSELEFIKSGTVNADSVPADLKLYQAKGCERCSQTGYEGRTVIAEGFIVDDQVAKMITNGEPEVAISKYLQEEQQMQTMLNDGIAKVIAGMTTISEIQRQLGSA